MIVVLDTTIEKRMKKYRPSCGCQCDYSHMYIQKNPDGSKTIKFNILMPCPMHRRAAPFIRLMS